jgi:hypothetical protein
VEKIQAYNLFIGIINLVVFELPIWSIPCPLCWVKVPMEPIRVAPNFMAKGKTSP